MGRRLKDVLAGAVGMLLVLMVVAAILWWRATDPADDAEGGAGTAPEAEPWLPPGAEPPDSLGEDEAWFAELSLDAAVLVTADTGLHDVQALGQDVVTSPEGAVAERLVVSATVPFEVVADELGGGARVGPGADGQATVVRAIEVLDRELRVVASGTVEVEDGRLVVEPRSIDVGGPAFLADAAADVVRRLVTIEHEIDGLPEGLVLRDVVVQGDGFRATLSGEDVELTP